MGLTEENKVMVGARIDPFVKELAEKIADSQGISLSEYIRKLIVEDLDKRTFFTTKVKEGLKK